MGIKNDLKGIKLRRRHLILYTMITSIVAAVVATPTAAAASPSSSSTESNLQPAAHPSPPAIPHCVEQQERRIGRR